MLFFLFYHFELFLNDISGICHLFLLAVLLPFRMALHRYKNLKKADGKKQFFFGKYTKRKIGNLL